MAQQDEGCREDEERAVAQSRLPARQRPEHRRESGPCPALDVDRERDREHVRNDASADGDQRRGHAARGREIFAWANDKRDRREQQQCERQEPQAMKQDELHERRRGAWAPWILREPVEREKTAAADRVPGQDRKPDPPDGEPRCNDAPHQPRAASNRRR